MNHPCQHYEFNEAWIYSDAGAIYPSDPGDSGKNVQGSEKFANGRTKASWHGKVLDSGRYVLNGPEIWKYENGKTRYFVTYKNGKKIGPEEYWTPDGVKRWTWMHNENGTSVWMQYWDNGQRKCESTWIDGKCEGVATRWDRYGNVISKAEFKNGIMND
jgi:antitoxin component YwqK of YwqJK toxin-antitoxin module